MAFHYSSWGVLSVMTVRQVLIYLIGFPKYLLAEHI